MRGDYQLRILDATKTNEPLKNKDIRGPATTVKFYDATISGTPAQSGPSYENTDTTITQDIIALSADMITDGYDAYFVKGGVLTKEGVSGTEPNTIQHAYLTQNGDGSYTASATFNMKNEDAGDYKLVIYPSGLKKRIAIPAKADSNDPEKLKMQFVSTNVAKIICYSITDAKYTPNESYSTITGDLVKDQPFIETPEVVGKNPNSTKLSYIKKTGSSDFSVDLNTGKIICSSDPKSISNGYYTIKIEVSDISYPSDPSNPNSPPITGPGMVCETNVSFVVTGSSDVSLTGDNLYIYNGYYTIGIGTARIPNTGIYNIIANTTGTAYIHSIIIMEGTHTDGKRIVLNESITAAASLPAIEVKSGATAQIGIPDGAVLTLTGASGQPAILADGTVSITAGAADTGTLALNGGASASGVSGSGSFTQKAATITATGTAVGINTTTTTIEGGMLTTNGISGTNVSLKGGNIKTTEGISATSHPVTITGGSIIGTVNNPKDTKGNALYPVTIKVSGTPANYNGTKLTLNQSNLNDTSLSSTWSAKASSSSFNKSGGLGEMYVYLPHYSKETADSAYTTMGIVDGTNTYSRNIRANKTGELVTSLLTTGYTINLPTTPITGTATVGQGAFANINIKMAADDGWLYDGRSLALSVAPNKDYRGLWGNYLLKKEGADAYAYKPIFWIKTQDGQALEKEGVFGTMTENNRTKGLAGSITVPANSNITEGSYKSQIDWTITPKDPIVGGNP